MFGPIKMREMLYGMWFDPLVLHIVIEIIL